MQLVLVRGEAEIGICFKKVWKENKQGRRESEANVSSSALGTFARSGGEGGLYSHVKKDKGVFPCEECVQVGLFSGRSARP